MAIFYTDNDQNNEDQKRKLEESEKRLQEAIEKLENIKRKKERDAEIQKARDERDAEIQKVNDEKKEAERKLARIKQMEIEAENSIKKDEDEKNRKKNEIKNNILIEKNKILEEEEKIKDLINELAKEKEICKMLVKRYKNNILVFTNKLKEVQKIEQEKISEKKKIVKKIESQERLYDPNRIKSISDYVSLRIFYDLEMKKKAYWKSTDFINRIEIREKDWKEELNLGQNIVKLKINWTPGEKERIETLNAGGVMEHHPFDAPTYNLVITIAIQEQYLIKKIMSLVKASFPKMSVFQNKSGVSAYLEDQNYDEVYSRRMIQTTTRRICEDFEKLGDVMID